MTAYVLRLAGVDELDTAMAIDDAASLLFKRLGLVVDLPSEHPFVLGERARWRGAIAQGQLWFACHGSEPVGFGALGRAGGAAYLEQLSVVPEHGRRGVGTMLLAAACAHLEHAGEHELWLTTYAHVPWNKPYYERQGFTVVAESQCNADLRAHLDEQRATLPDPAQRVAMMRELGRSLA